MKKKKKSIRVIRLDKDCQYDVISQPQNSELESIHFLLLPEVAGSDWLFDCRFFRSGLSGHSTLDMSVA